MTPFSPLAFVHDPRSRDYEDRRTWLARHDTDPIRVGARQRLGALLLRLGRWVEGHHADMKGECTATHS